MATISICSIPDCGKPSRTKGLCQGHYLRLLRYGDPLSGGTMSGDPLRFIHDVALSHGEDECLIWPFGGNGKGYATVYIDGERFVASRYVCTVVNGTAPTSKHQAAHSCGNRLCVNPSHLRWATRSENEADKVDHGTSNRGARQGISKLTETDVIEIRRLKGVKTQKDIAKQFGISRGNVYFIHKGKRWSWLDVDS